MAKVRKARSLKSSSPSTKAAPAKTVPVMTRVSAKLKKKLQAIAKHEQRSEAHMARVAIEALVELNEAHIATIKRGLDEARSGVQGIPHEDIEAWVESLGTDRKLPMPVPRS